MPAPLVGIQVALQIEARQQTLNTERTPRELQSSQREQIPEAPDRGQ